MTTILSIGFIHQQNKVLSYEGNYYYNVECLSCGKIRRIWHYNILRTKSCRHCAQPQVKNSPHKIKRTINGKAIKEYSAFISMRQHILETASPSKIKSLSGTIYEGIELQPEWQTIEGFEDFYSHMGPAFKGAILDRVNNLKGYIKGNMRWATLSQSNMNQRRARMITAMGKTQNLAEWARETGISATVIKNRILRQGWEIERALSTPIRPHRKYEKRNL